MRWPTCVHVDARSSLATLAAELQRLHDQTSQVLDGKVDGFNLSSEFFKGSAFAFTRGTEKVQKRLYVPALDDSQPTYVSQKADSTGAKAGLEFVVDATNATAGRVCVVASQDLTKQIISLIPDDPVLVGTGGTFLTPHGSMTLDTGGDFNLVFSRNGVSKLLVLDDQVMSFVDVNPEDDAVSDLGQDGLRWANVYSPRLSAGTGGDLEVQADGNLELRANDGDTGAIGGLYTMGGLTPLLQWGEEGVKVLNGGLFIGESESVGAYINAFELIDGFRELKLPNVDGTFWTSGNDGAGSTLDSDLLDGQEGAFYTAYADAAVAAHVALADPHAQYQKESGKNTLGADGYMGTPSAMTGSRLTMWASYVAGSPLLETSAFGDNAVYPAYFPSSGAVRVIQTHRLNAQTMSGNITLVTYSATSTGATTQLLDPNGSNRIVTMPTAVPGGSNPSLPPFHIFHVGSANTITVQTAGAVTITTLGAGDSCLLISDGTVWKCIDTQSAAGPVFTGSTTVAQLAASGQISAPSFSAGNDANGQIELGPTVSGGGETPYIDFHFGDGVSRDNTARIIGDGSDQITVSTRTGGFYRLGASKLGVNRTATTYPFEVEGEIYATNQVRGASVVSEEFVYEDGGTALIDKYQLKAGTVRVYLSGDFTTSDSSENIVPFDSTHFDNLGGGLSGGSYEVPEDGLYEVRIVLGFRPDNSTDGYTFLRLLIDESSEEAYFEKYGTNRADPAVSTYVLTARINIGGGHLIGVTHQFQGDDGVIDGTGYSKSYMEITKVGPFLL